MILPSLSLLLVGLVETWPRPSYREETTVKLVMNRFFCNISTLKWHSEYDIFYVVLKSILTWPFLRFEPVLKNTLL